MRRRPLLAMGTAVTTAVSLLALGTTGAAAALHAPELPGVAAGDRDAATYDVRRTAGTVVAPTAAQLDAVRRLAAAAGSGTRATWDERFGTPRSIRRDGGYLTRPSTGAAREVARQWLSDNRAAFACRPRTSAPSPSSGTTPSPAPAPAPSSCSSRSAAWRPRTAGG